MKVLTVLIAILAPLASAPGAETQNFVDARRVAEIAAWLPAHPQVFGKPASDRESWNKLAALPEARDSINAAEQLAKTTFPELPDDLYLDFSRTGNRTRCQNVMSVRDRRVPAFALAECLEGKGRFIGPLSNIVAAICGERTWVLPAHDSKLVNFNGTDFQPDLRATMVAWDLATCHFLLDEKLPSETRKLIQENVRRRVLSPFKEMSEGKRSMVHWIKATHNWNAVCLAGMTGAALALEDSPEERAFFVAAAEKGIASFLSGFTPDGYCSEGVGYWNYGYGRFLILAELIRQNTDGKIDLFSAPGARQPAFFAIRSEVINGIYPSLADCSPQSAPSRDLVWFIRQRFGEPDKSYSPAPLGQGDRTLAFLLMNACMPAPLPRIAGESTSVELPLRTWFNDGGVLICRPAQGKTPFAAVIKGGHNAEHHNHNDLGSFSVLLGKTVLICDPGSEEYTKRTFSPQRYDSKVLNSYGHDVPVLGGKLQRSGRDAKAVVLATRFGEAADSITFDLSSAYTLPELKKMERSFDYVRGAQPALVVRDTVSFSEAQSFETALLTWSAWKQIGPAELVIGEGKESVRVSIDSDGRPVEISSETIDEDVRTPSKPVRIRLALAEPVKDAEFTIKVTPGN